MAIYPINTAQREVDQELRKIETSDPVHADVYNALFEKLINNDAYLERLANMMIKQTMIAHVLDSANTDMVLGADVGPKITQLVNNVDTRVDRLNSDLNVAKTDLSNSKLSWINGSNYNSDVNNLKESGFYLYNTNSVSNLPTYEADNAFYILVFKYNDLSIIQFYIGFVSFNTIGVYARGNWGGTWRSWIKLG